MGMAGIGLLLVSDSETECSFMVKLFARLGKSNVSESGLAV